VKGEAEKGKKGRLAGALGPFGRLSYLGDFNTEGQKPFALGGKSAKDADGQK